MNPDSKIYLYLAVIAVASWMLANVAGVDTINRGLLPPHSPDYFSVGYAKWTWDEVGTLTSKLLADNMSHYRDDRKTYLQQPVFQSFSGRRDGANAVTPPWVVHADSGVLSADGNDLQLNGKVTIARAGGGALRPLQINTADLNVKLETRHAETAARAELLSAANRTTGTGMKLVFAEPVRLQLLSRVQGKYEIDQ